MNAIGPSLILASAFTGLFALAEILYRFAGLPAELTRKIVHIGTGCLTLLFPIMLHSALEVGILCGAFLIILLASMRLKLLPSINAVERDTLGSVLYPVIVFLVFLFYLHSAHQAASIAAPLYYFYTPILVMALCDPIAAMAGMAWRKTHPDIPLGKTMAGSFAFFASAAIVAGTLAACFYKPGLPPQAFVLTGIMLAFLSGLAERFSGRGWDNFTIPGIVVAGIQVFELGLQSLVR